MNTFMNAIAKAADTFIIRPARAIEKTCDSFFRNATCFLCTLFKSPTAMLYRSVYFNAPAITRLAVWRGAKFTNEEYPYNSAIEIATRLENWDMMRLLVELGATPNLHKECFNAYLKNREIPLFAALCHPEAPDDLAQVLVNHGAEVDCVLVESKQSLIEYAASNNMTNVVRFLGKNGANPRFHSENTENLLANAVENCHFATAITLMESGLSPTENPGRRFLRKHGHKHLILVAAKSPHPQTHIFVTEAIRHGASATARNKLGETALHIATDKRNDLVCRALLEAEGAHLVSLRDNKGKTPLENALETNWMEGAELMLQYQTSIPHALHRKPLPGPQIALIQKYAPSWKHKSQL